MSLHGPCAAFAVCLTWRAANTHHGPWQKACTLVGSAAPWEPFLSRRSTGIDPGLPRHYTARRKDRSTNPCSQCKPRRPGPQHHPQASGPLQDVIAVPPMDTQRTKDDANAPRPTTLAMQWGASALRCQRRPLRRGARSSAALSDEEGSNRSRPEHSRGPTSRVDHAALSEHQPAGDAQGCRMPWLGARRAHATHREETGHLGGRFRRRRSLGVAVQRRPGAQPRPRRWLPALPKRAGSAGPAGAGHVVRRADATRSRRVTRADGTRQSVRPRHGGRGLGRDARRRAPHLAPGGRAHAALRRRSNATCSPGW